MHRLDHLFQQFLRERIYVKNVTSKTRVWYETAWKAFRASRSTDDSERAALITQADLNDFVVQLRERGVKPVSCNSWLRALKCLLPLAA